MSGTVVGRRTEPGDPDDPAFAPLRRGALVQGVDPADLVCSWLVLEIAVSGPDDEPLGVTEQRFPSVETAPNPRRAQR